VSIKKGPEQEPEYTEEELKRTYEQLSRTRHSATGKMRDAAATVAEHALAKVRGEPGVHPDYLAPALRNFGDMHSAAHAMEYYRDQALLHGNHDLAVKFQKLGDDIHGAAFESFNEVAPDLGFKFM